MIFSLALSLIAVASGALLTYTYEDDAPLAARLCSGACIGFAGMGLVGFIFASFLGLTFTALVLTFAAVAAPLLLLIREPRRRQVNIQVNQATAAISRAIAKPDRWAIIYFVFYGAVVVSMWLIFSRALLDKPEGIYTGVLNNYGDLPFHLSVITRFAFGQNFPPEDPTFAGIRFTYPFITDFISAMFVRAGASLRDAMFIENWIIAVALVGVLHRFGLKLVRNRTAAILTPIIVLLNGGFGWWMIFSDVNKSDGGIFQVLSHIPHSYTILPDVAQGWRWGNSITSLLVTQRGFLLGIPLAVIVFTQWWASLQSSEEGKGKKAKGKEEASQEKKVEASSLFPFSFFLLPSVRRMLAAGAIAGSLPLIHAHSFIVVMGMAGCLALINFRRWREWLVFILLALIIATPQMLWSTHGSAVNTRAFISWYVGWDNAKENFFLFWLKNTGVFVPLLIAALLWKSEEYLVPRKLLLFYLPFTLCFIGPNLVKLAPWIWDNIKVLFYWWIASAPIVALLLARLWESGKWNRILAAGLFVVLTLAGALDIFPLLTAQGEYQEFDREGVAFAKMIQERTPPRSTILHAPVHNTPIFLTGRRSLMGYPGHIWTHGLEFGPREAEIKRIYSGAADAESLLAKYGVDYVVVDPQEHSVMSANAAFFSRYPEIANIGEYHLYKIKP